MRFTDDQLRKFAHWESVAPGFDGDDPTPIKSYIEPAIARITASGQFFWHILEDGGHGNYYAVFLYGVEFQADISGLLKYVAVATPGICVCLSLLAPVAVFGPHCPHIRPKFFGGGYVEPEDVRDPADASNPLELSIVREFAQTPYTFMTRADVCVALPEGIPPIDYCDVKEPWNKVFHAIFSNSD